MNREREEDQLLRRLEIATRRRGDDSPELLDTESCMLHDGWERLTQMLDRATAEHDSVVVEERLLRGVQRQVVQRRMRRRVISIAVAASVLGVFAIGAWIGLGRTIQEIAQPIRGVVPDSPFHSVRSPDDSRLNFAADWYPPAGSHGSELAAEDDVWSDELDWQVSETREFITLLEEELANDFL
ncbi:MAG: hypothetical protein HZA46_12940 [Planctomycetales bacterium]|nr:hypothetical protein [Planctomycetales bacterium]